MILERLIVEVGGVDVGAAKTLAGVTSATKMSERALRSYTGAQRGTTAEIREGERAWSSQSRSGREAASAMTAARRAMIVADEKFIRTQGLMHTQALKMNAAFDARPMQLMHAEALKMNVAFDAAARSSAGGTVGLGRFNNMLGTMVARVAGVNPMLGRFGTILGSFAMGSAMMAGVLLGLGAIAAALRKIGEKGREAKEVLAEARSELQALVRAGEIADIGGEMGVNVRRAIQELSRLNARQAVIGRRDPTTGQMVSPGAGEGGREFERNAAEIIKLNEEIAAGEAAVTAALAKQNEVREDTVAEINREIDALTKLAEANLRAMEPFMMLHTQIARPTLLNGRGMDIATAFGTGPMGVDRSKAAQDGILASARAMQDNMVRVQTERLAAEKALGERRDQAQEALIQGMVNVGHAFGGLADKLMSIAASVISVSRAGRLPGFEKGGNWRNASIGDKAIGLGSSAMAGIGIGTSTANPVLGGLGGAASGFAMAGPVGAIVGGVTGIVSGLLEQGNRAREAARLWKMAMADYKLMWDEQTDQQRNETENRRRFMEATGGRSPEDVRRMLDASSPAQQWKAGITKWNELLAIYDENALQIEALGLAADSAADSLSEFASSINAPSGFKLNWERFQATIRDGIRTGTGAIITSSYGSGERSGGGNVTIGVVNLYPERGEDGPALYKRFVNEAARQASLGGADELTVVMQGTY